MSLLEHHLLVYPKDGGGFVLDKDASDNTTVL